VGDPATAGPSQKVHPTPHPSTPTPNPPPNPQGTAAERVCEELSLDSAACMDLFVGALGVAMVLSLLCAVPIFKICRLSECGKAPGGGRGLGARGGGAE